MNKGQTISRFMLLIVGTNLPDNTEGVSFNRKTFLWQRFLIVATLCIFLKHFCSCSSHIFRCVLVTTTWIVLLTSHHSFSLTLTFKIKRLSKNDHI